MKLYYIPLAILLLSGLAHYCGLEAYYHQRVYDQHLAATETLLITHCGQDTIQASDMNACATAYHELLDYYHKHAIKLQDQQHQRTRTLHKTYYGCRISYGGQRMLKSVQELLFQHTSSSS